MPVLSPDEWRRLETISTRGVDEFIRACAVNGNVESLQNAIEADCVHRGDIHMRLSSVADAFAERGPELAGIARAWTKSFAQGPLDGNESWKITPDMAMEILTKLMSTHVDNCEEGSFDLIRMLVDVGVDPVQTKYAGSVSIKSPLERAIAEVNLPALRLFLGEDRVFDTDNPPPTLGDGLSIVEVAADIVRTKGDDYRKSFDEVVSHLAPSYTQPFETLFEEALRQADSLSKSGEMVKSLLDIATLISLGARPGPGRSWAELIERPAMGTTAHDFSPAYLPLAHAILTKSTDEKAGQILSILVQQAGMDVNLRDDFGATLLHRAAAYQKHDVIETLLALGADATLGAANFDTNNPDRTIRAVDVLQRDYDRGSITTSEQEFHRSQQQLNAAAAIQVIAKTVAQSKAAVGATP
jgi:hypothetical protein